MPDSADVIVRPFARTDRDQVTHLINAHVAAVVPGVSISVSTMLGHLEREPGEFIVDPWVARRATLVAQQRNRVVAAAHLRCFRTDQDVSASLRGSGEIGWLVFWPDAPFWPDATLAADRLMGACLAQLHRWQPSSIHVDGGLPAPGAYGVSEQWPHLRSLYQRAGFTSAGRVETVHIIRVSDLPVSERGELRLLRTLGVSGTRLTAMAGDQIVGMIEVDSRLESGERSVRGEGLADVGNLEFTTGEAGRWLMSQARRWLQFGGVTRLLAYTTPDQEDHLAFLADCGFEVLTRTVRDLSLDIPAAGAGEQR